MARASSVDGGWGWVITFAVFCTNILCVGYFRAFGVFFVEIIDTFQTSSSMTSLIMGVQNAVCCVTVLLVYNVLLDHLEIRTCGRVGGLVMSVGMMLAALANSVSFFILTLGVLVGIGNAFTYGPGIVLLGQYFLKRRALVNSLASMGASVGSMILPVLATHLIIQYGLRGALLLYGAVTFHICIFTSLYQPFVDPGMTSAENDDDKDECEKALLETTVGTDHGQLSPQAQGCGISNGTNVCKVDASDLPSVKTTDNNHTFITVPLSDSKELQPSPCLSEPFNVSHSTCYGNTKLIPSQEGPKLFSSDSRLFNGKSKLQDTRKHSLSVAQLPADITQRKERQRGFTFLSRLHLENSLQHLSQPQLVVEAAKTTAGLEAMDLALHHRGSTISDNSADDEDSGKRTSCRKLCKYLSCDPSLFRMPTFWLVQVYVCVAIMGATGGGTYMPVLMQEKGLNKNDTAVALAIWGAANLLGRLLSGLLADRNLLSPATISSIGFLGIGVLFMSVSYLPLTVWAWTMFSTLFGLLEGVYFSMLPDVIISLVTQSHFRQTFGYVQLSQSMFASANYPLLGGLKDLTGSYNSTFHLLGAYALTAAFLLQVMPIVRGLKSCSSGGQV